MRLLHFICSGMLLVAIGSMPIGYYTILRFVITIGAVAIVIQEFDGKITPWVIVFGLIGVRIALGLSQKEFADELGVSEAQVSRDENNEYHGITLDKAQRILETFNVKFKAEIEELVSKSRKDKNPMLFA